MVFESGVRSILGASLLAILVIDSDPSSDDEKGRVSCSSKNKKIERTYPDYRPPPPTPIVPPDDDYVPGGPSPL